MPSVYIQSSVFLPTPSGGAGAVELLVAKMAEGLAKRGWDVTLFGLEGSRLDVDVPMATVPAAGTSEQREQSLVSIMAPLISANGPPDVIFDHSLHMFAGQRRGPYVAMSHGMAPLPSWAHNVVFTSKHHGRLHGRKDPQALLLGIDLADIPPSYGVVREGLFWAGRIMPYKRLHLACEIARLVGAPLRVAGPVVDEAYWRDICATYLAPAVGAPVFTYLGELPREAVLREMARAWYFLFTSDETEPAGLVMLESAACGTPVISINDASAREYVGGAGWIFPDDVKGAAYRAAMPVPDYVHADARQAVLDGGTIDHMVTRAEDYLRRAISGERW